MNRKEIGIRLGYGPFLPASQKASLYDFIFTSKIIGVNSSSLNINFLDRFHTISITSLLARHLLDETPNQPFYELQYGAFSRRS